MKSKWPWQFLMPQLTLCAVFLLLPLCAVFAISLFDWNLVGGHRFVGLGNYAELLEDRQFWRALGNTLLYAAVIVPSTLGAGLLLALALNRPLRGRSVLRSAIYLPTVISGVASGTIAVWIFDEHYGVLNGLLGAIGLTRLPWLSSTMLAMPAVMGTTIWLRTGLCMVVYLAALQDVPKDQLEAAALDGADAWNRFRHVTWPVLGASTTFLLVTNLIYSLHVFDLIYVMTEGGPSGSTKVLVEYLYDAAFDQQRQGYGSAIGVVLLVVLTGLTALLTGRRERAV